MSYNQQCPGEFQDIYHKAFISIKYTVCKLITLFIRGQKKKEFLPEFSIKLICDVTLHSRHSHL